MKDRCRHMYRVAMVIPFYFHEEKYTDNGVLQPFFISIQNIILYHATRMQRTLVNKTEQNK
jgi:hypothetical protein